MRWKLGCNGCRRREKGCRCSTTRKSGRRRRGHHRQNDSERDEPCAQGRRRGQEGRRRHGNDRFSCMRVILYKRSQGSHTHSNDKRKLNNKRRRRGQHNRGTVTSQPVERAGHAGARKALGGSTRHGQVAAGALRLHPGQRRSGRCRRSDGYGKRWLHGRQRRPEEGG